LAGDYEIESMSLSTVKFRTLGNVMVAQEVLVTCMISKFGYTSATCGRMLSLEGARSVFKGIPNGEVAFPYYV
jgi:hypothetical protein